ncbi:polyamine-modulated factor 1-binding protein 1-like [Callorhinchus milii]|uniref:polyamine-modulated factor 1-binding protein 1-like n=1 Tax=Callorhinchus milii TaxID=7868 RepID=UPI001C3F705C|nr:polyamine-modulated factor 1-binding protein 1-like [Callorhinchus milii]
MSASDGDVTVARTEAEAGRQVAQSSLHRSTQALLAAQGVVSARRDMETQTATVRSELQRVQTTLEHIAPLLAVSQKRARREEELLEIRLQDVAEVETLVAEVERETECHTSQRLQLSQLHTHLLSLHQALQHNVQRRRNRSGAMSVAESCVEQESRVTGAALERASQAQRRIEQLARAQTQLTHNTLQELREVLQVFRKQEEALSSLEKRVTRLQEQQGHLLAGFQQAEPPACN